MCHPVILNTYLIFITATFHEQWSNQFSYNRQNDSLRMISHSLLRQSYQGKFFRDLETNGLISPLHCSPHEVRVQCECALRNTSSLC